MESVLLNDLNIFKNIKKIDCREMNNDDIEILIGNNKIILTQYEAQEFVNKLELLVYDELPYGKLEDKYYTCLNKIDRLENELDSYKNRNDYY